MACAHLLLFHKCALQGFERRLHIQLVNRLLWAQCVHSLWIARSFAFFIRANFLGVNISVLGSILYTYVTFRRKTLQAGSGAHQREILVAPVEKRALLP